MPRARLCFEGGFQNSLPLCLHPQISIATVHHEARICQALLAATQRLRRLLNSKNIIFPLEL